MTNFKEFYALLDGIRTKEKTDIVPSEANFSLFMANRYLSFLLPEICKMLAQTTNMMGFVRDAQDYDSVYETFCAIIPKLPRTRIAYVRKPVTEAQIESGLDDDDVKALARHYELGTEEVRNMLGACLGK